MEPFYSFLAYSIKYPQVARKNKVQGEVLISFIIEKNGELTNFHAIWPVSKELYAEAVRVVKLTSPWKPGLLYGIIRSQGVIIPVNFNLNSY